MRRPSLRGSFHSLALDHTTTRHHSRHSCYCFHQLMDCSFRGSSDCYNGSRPPIRITRLAATDASARLQANSDHGLSPIANGLVERFHLQVKAAIIATGYRSNWAKRPPFIMLGLRAALKRDIGCSTAELEYGAALRLPGQFFEPKPVEQIDLHGSCLLIHITSTASFNPQATFSCAVRYPAPNHNRGPFKVLSKRAKNFLLDVNGKTQSVSIDRLKPAYVDS